MAEESRPEDSSVLETQASGLQPAPVGPSRWDVENDEVSLVSLLNILLHHRRIVVGTPLVIAALLVGLGLVSRRTYTVNASFMPQTAQSQASRFTGVAAQFGISIPQSEAGNSPQFYADLLGSNNILRKAVESQYSLQDGTQGNQASQGSLIDLYGIERGEHQERLMAAVHRLDENLKASTRRETGVVDLTVTTPWASVSNQVAERLLELVNEFNLDTRRSQASKEREFIESRLHETRTDLEAVEDELQQFLEQNRSYNNSPDLLFKYDRLQRRVNLRQELYTSISQSYEQAKIDEVRNTPVITVVEPPQQPILPDGRGIRTKGFLGIILGGIIGVFWAFGSEFMLGERERKPEEYEEFRQICREIVGSFQKRWRNLRRMLRLGSS